MKNVILISLTLISMLFSGDISIEIEGKIVSSCKLLLTLTPESSPLLGVQNPKQISDINGLANIVSRADNVSLSPLFSGYQSFNEGCWKHNLHRYYILSFESYTAIDTLAADIKLFSEIESVEFITYYHAELVPNDPAYNNQWEHNNVGSGQIYHLNGQEIPATQNIDIDSDDAWDITTGSEDITIAIIDMWVDPDVIDFDGKIVDPINLSGWADEETERHGTYVASVAAALGNNEFGIAGVCWGCKILPIQIFYDVCDESD